MSDLLRWSGDDDDDEDDDAPGGDGWDPRWALATQKQSPVQHKHSSVKTSASKSVNIFAEVGVIMNEDAAGTFASVLWMKLARFWASRRFENGNAFSSL